MRGDRLGREGHFILVSSDGRRLSRERNWRRRTCLSRGDGRAGNVKEDGTEFRAARKLPDQIEDGIFWCFRKPGRRQSDPSN